MGVLLGLVVQLLFLGLVLVGLAGGLVVDLLEVVIVHLGFQIVLQAPVGWLYVWQWRHLVLKSP